MTMPNSGAPTRGAPTEIVELDPEDFDIPEGFDPERTPGFKNLYRDIDQNGQHVEVLAYPPECLPGRYGLIDGLHRVEICRRLHRKARTIVHPKPASEMEKLALILSVNANRRKVGFEERRDMLLRGMKLKPGWTQKKLGAYFGFSERQVSQLLAVGSIPEADMQRLKDAGVCDTSILLIGPLTTEKMVKAIDFAVTPDEDGIIPSRDALALHIKGLKSKNSGRPSGDVKAGDKAAVPQVKIRLDSTHDEVIRQLKGMIDTIGAHKNLPLKVVVAILNGSQPSK